MPLQLLPKYILIIIAATFLTFFFHELFHWIAYELMGYDAYFSLNSANLNNDEIEMTAIQRNITSAAGPLFTIAQGIFFFFLLKKHNTKLLYPFLFLPFIMRLGALGANYFMPNDEGRISLSLGLNLYAISAIVVLFLLFLVIKISRRNSYSFWFNILTWFLSGLMILGLTFLDSKLDIRFF